jgi:hypothetical protein
MTGPKDPVDAPVARFQFSLACSTAGGTKFPAGRIEHATVALCSLSALDIEPACFFFFPPPLSLQIFSTVSAQFFIDIHYPGEITL